MSMHTDDKYVHSLAQATKKIMTAVKEHSRPSPAMKRMVEYAKKVFFPSSGSVKNLAETSKAVCATYQTVQQ